MMTPRTVLFTYQQDMKYKTGNAKKSSPMTNYDLSHSFSHIYWLNSPLSDRWPPQSTSLNLDMIRIISRTSHLFLVIIPVFTLVRYSKNEGVKHIDWPSHVITIWDDLLSTVPYSNFPLRWWFANTPRRQSVREEEEELVGSIWYWSSWFVLTINNEYITTPIPLYCPLFPTSSPPTNYDHRV